MTITVYRASGTLPILVLPFTLSVVDAAIDAVTDDVTDTVTVTANSSESDEDLCLLASLVPG